MIANRICIGADERTRLRSLFSCRSGRGLRPRATGASARPFSSLSARLVYPARAGCMYMVRTRGLEPPIPCGNKHLKLARIPFRHVRELFAAVVCQKTAPKARIKKRRGRFGVVGHVLRPQACTGARPSLCWLTPAWQPIGRAWKVPSMRECTASTSRGECVDRADSLLNVQ